MPTDCQCPCHADEMAVVALVEKMFDAAEGAGVDLWLLEQHRGQVERDIVACDGLRDQVGVVTGRACELRESIELGVDALAKAFVHLRAIVEQDVRRVRC